MFQNGALWFKHKERSIETAEVSIEVIRKRGMADSARVEGVQRASIPYFGPPDLKGANRPRLSVRYIVEWSIGQWRKIHRFGLPPYRPFAGG